VVKISRVEVRWLGHCLKFGSASREVAHYAHGYGTGSHAPSIDITQYILFVPFIRL
jgi:hypothetical protein